MRAIDEPYLRGIAIRMHRFPLMKVEVWMPKELVKETIVYLLITYPHLIIGPGRDSNLILIRFPQCRV